MMFVRYLLFAVLATVANLATQEFVIRIAPVAPLTLSILMGTAAGFILKYLLDKKWVFDDAYGGHRKELRKITLYGAFSVLTTSTMMSASATARRPKKPPGVIRCSFTLAGSMPITWAAICW